MYAAWGIGLNSLEQRSFYSFLTLYIVSSFLFIILSGYWYYIAQKSSLESNDHFQMRHISDLVSNAVIQAHMQKHPLRLPKRDPAFLVTLIDKEGKVVHGPVLKGIIVENNRYFREGDRTVLISDTAHGHLNIAYVVVQGTQLHQLLHTLMTTVLAMMSLIAISTVLIAWMLSRLFMRPIRQKIDQVETFIKDVTHELNTPITALSMATERALKKEIYDEKALRNISISTKQLFDIYRSLTYLNFAHKEEKAVRIDLEVILLKSIAYYKELCDSKRITIHVESEPYHLAILQEQASMLFGNLISNAIKYSLADSEIRITLKEGLFSIEDHGIGIEKERLSKIFERYNRETEYAGGFGVGLNIVQSICQENHITIDVISEPDKGSVFTLSFQKKQDL